MLGRFLSGQLGVQRHQHHGIALRHLGQHSPQRARTLAGYP
jgi:hypothetical protein